MPPPSERWVNSKAVGEHLGKSAQWVRAYGLRRGIPHSYLGRQLRFRLSEVDQWLKEQEAP